MYIYRVNSRWAQDLYGLIKEGETEREKKERRKKEGGGERKKGDRKERGYALYFTSHNRRSFFSPSFPFFLPPVFLPLLFSPSLFLFPAFFSLTLSEIVHVYLLDEIIIALVLFHRRVYT